MNNTFQRVAALCGLRLSYYTTATLLTISFLGLIITDYRTPSPLYILLALAILPSIMEAIFFSDKKAEKRENDLSFPLFCKKYHYSSTRYKSMNLAYLLLFVLLGAWHISYTANKNLPALVSLLPALIAALSLLTRFFGIIGYRIYFHFFPLKAMH